LTSVPGGSLVSRPSIYLRVDWTRPPMLGRPVAHAMPAGPTPLFKIHGPTQTHRLIAATDSVSCWLLSPPSLADLYRPALVTSWPGHILDHR